MRSLTLVGGTASKCFAKASMVKQAMSIAMRAGSLQNTGALVRAASSSSKPSSKQHSDEASRAKVGARAALSKTSLGQVLRNSWTTP
eukprot:CAMPEP_0206516868 /NCGR_PEP_ID=MMETSP0324_2-20121206/63611_1 /ASSEMBLY_ACC=CAM_ASM_000836 /TAXON_ID=2866 /ORGANISM="Crypthecodinium cohnii, Strain Seligo" /LENGTH=86 /DNA_ID=CAMNT_0054009859 /DNA_START=728 /DNA_END=989 /DNA_ORIENTATION=+